jgi:hypothetical protein
LEQQQHFAVGDDALVRHEGIEEFGVGGRAAALLRESGARGAFEGFSHGAVAEDGVELEDGLVGFAIDDAEDVVGDERVMMVGDVGAAARRSATSSASSCRVACSLPASGTKMRATPASVIL